LPIAACARHNTGHAPSLGVKCKACNTDRIAAGILAQCRCTVLCRLRLPPWACNILANQHPPLRDVKAGTCARLLGQLHTHTKHYRASEPSTPRQRSLVQHPIPLRHTAPPKMTIVATDHALTAGRGMRFAETGPALVDLALQFGSNSVGSCSAQKFRLVTD
jgi:hypothetical protein